MEETVPIDLAKYVVSEARLPSHAKRYFSNIIYFFLSSWAGGILQILQSDWFRERAVFSPSGPLTAGGIRSF